MIIRPPYDIDSSNNTVFIYGSIGAIISMIVAIAGIKFKWFRARLNLDNTERTRQRRSGDVAYVEDPSIQPLRSMYSFTYRDEFETDIQRTSALPPVRISTTGELELPVPASRRSDNENGTNNATLPTDNHETTPTRSTELQTPEIRVTKSPSPKSGKPKSIPKPPTRVPPPPRPTSLHNLEVKIDHNFKSVNTIDKVGQDEDTPPAIPSSPIPKFESEPYIVLLQDNQADSPDIPSVSFTTHAVVTCPPKPKTPSPKLKSKSQPNLTKLDLEGSIATSSSIQNLSSPTELEKNENLHFASDYVPPGSPKKHPSPKTRMIRVLKKSKEKVPSEPKIKEKRKENKSSESDKKHPSSITKSPEMKRKEEKILKSAIKPTPRTSGMDYRYYDEQKRNKSPSPLHNRKDRSQSKSPKEKKDTSPREQRVNISPKAPQRRSRADTNRPKSIDKTPSSPDEDDTWNLIARHRQTTEAVAINRSHVKQPLNPIATLHKTNYLQTKQVELIHKPRTMREIKKEHQRTSDESLKNQQEKMKFESTEDDADA